MKNETHPPRKGKGKEEAELCGKLRNILKICGNYEISFNAKKKMGHIEAKKRGNISQALFVWAPKNIHFLHVEVFEIEEIC